MWLRDSANQLQSYVSLLKPIPQPPQQQSSSSASASKSQDASTKPSKLASLFRGAINLQARYLLSSPHCNAFQPPTEATMEAGNDGNPSDLVFPHYDRSVVFECKYELDSLAAFLQLSWDYYSRTKDARFFTSSASAASTRERRGWKAAVVALLDTAEAMRVGTYTPNGRIPGSPYRFERVSSIPTETLGNRGNGNPVKAGTGMVRSAFRPSDDATTYQLLVPANMMMVKYLELCAEIMEIVEQEESRLAILRPGKAAQGGSAQAVADREEEDEDEGDREVVSDRMKRMAKEIKKGVEKFGKVKHPDFGEIYAYETDGFYSHHTMVSYALCSPCTTNPARSTRY